MFDWRGIKVMHEKYEEEGRLRARVDEVTMKSQASHGQVMGSRKRKYIHLCTCTTVE